MKLKRLTLQGYKTFASKTDFLFDDGLTVIVGPNGSGKSNIADALRWVLGEQSYGTLRGKRTTDMIFAGSQSRPRAGLAQATVVLDNSDGWLPIDYTEVEIGRRAYRSGENEYTLNGQKVRLKDVADLLATSGLAERTYTIIGQGLIDQALSLRAEERRALFEEAAGINQYKSKRAETLRRLQETQRNLERVYDILNEIRPRLAALKRQATRARNYEQVGADLRHLLRVWYGYRWEQAKTSLREARQTAVTAEKAWEQSRRSLLRQQENSHALQRRIDRGQQQLAELLEKRDGLRTELERTRREVAIMQERQQSLSRQLAEIEQERPLLNEQLTAAQANLAAALSDLVQAQTNLHQGQAQLSQFQATFQTQQAEISRWQKQLQENEAAFRTGQTRLAQAEGQLSQLQERLREQAPAQPTADSGELASLEEQIKQQTAVMQTAQTSADELRQRRSRLQNQQRVLIDELKQLRREGRQQEQQLGQSRSQVAGLAAKVDLLNQMQRKEVQTGQDVALVGQLASQLTVPSAHQTALEAALAERLATLIVADEAALWRLLQANREQMVTAVALQTTQLPDPKPPLPADPAIFGWASELVSYSSIIAPVAELLLGGILLVADAQTAYRLSLSLSPGTLAAAPNGFIAYAGGLVASGGQTSNSALAREVAWRQAQANLAQRREALEKEETAVAQLQNIIQDKQTELDTLQNEEGRLGRLTNEVGQQLAQAQRLLDRARQQQTFWRHQQENQMQERERLRIRAAEMERGLVEQQTAVGQYESAMQTARASLAALPVAAGQQQQQTLSQEVAATQTILAGRQAVVDSRRATLQQLERQLVRLQGQQAALQTQQTQLTLTSEMHGQTQLQQQLEQLESAQKPLQMRLAEDRAELREIQGQTAVGQKQTHELETRYTQAKIRLTQQENQIEGLQERIRADLGIVALTYDEDQVGATPLPMRDVVDTLPQITEIPHDLEDTIQNYRGQLHRMGAINADAPKEYDETQERHDFLSQQVEDLQVTDTQLRKVVDELDELTSRAFADTVNKVNNVFGDIFTELFGGGAARLVLTDPDDLTVSGVDIIARLPNRREQGLGLLSGGERSLTAAALIFSLLKVSPTPFCVMDEVDAALDEANITRFRNLLRELSLQTQIIVITHNRGTVQAAQTIYGISMGSDSVSQALSIKPEEYLSQPRQLV